MPVSLAAARAAAFLAAAESASTCSVTSMSLPAKRRVSVTVTLL